MNWVLLIPPGVAVHHIEADVPEPVLVPADDHEAAAKKIRLLALEREMRALRAELGDGPAPVAARVDSITGLPVPVRHPEPAGPEALAPVGDLAGAHRYAGTFVGADGVARTELHHTERRPGPGYVCACGQAFYSPDAHAQHAARCAMALEQRTMRGNSIVHVHGSAVPAFRID